MSPGKIFLWSIAALTILRVALVVLEEPSPAEAYYFLCSQKPALAYFDGPAGTAAVVGWGSALAKPDTLWRLQAPFWGLAASLVCFALVRSVKDATLAAWTALGLNALPVVNMLSLRVGPALPSITFLLVAFWCSWKAFDVQKSALLRWLSAGVAAGLAASFAYAAVAIVPAVIFFTLCSPRHRKAWDFLGLLVFLLVPLLMLAPALAWNASLEWIPIAGGTLQTLWHFEFAGFFISLAQLTGGFSPVLFVMLFAAFVLLARESCSHVRARFLFLAALPGVALAVYFALRGKEAEFFFLLAAPVLLAGMLLDGPAKGWRRMLLAVGFGLAVLFSAYGMFNVFQTGHGWRRTAESVKDVFLEKSAEPGDEGLFLVAGDVELASVLGYHLRNDLIPPEGHPAVYSRESQDISDQFDLWPSYADFIETLKPKDEFFTGEQPGENPFIGRSALYITRESANDVPQSITAAFETVTLLKELPPAGNNAEPLYIYLCHNYQTMPL